MAIMNKNWLLLAGSFYLLLATQIATASSEPATKIITRYSLPLIGDAAYPPDFSHFDYVNPSAPKGGTLKLATIGSYDSLNQYNTKGRPAAGLYTLYDRLMVRAYDEPYTLYPLIATSLQYPEGYAWVAFNLNPNARFHDGKPLTAEDVVFTFNMLKTSGSPFFKNNFKDVLSARSESPHRVVFELGPGRGIKLLAYVAFIPIMSREFWQNRSFDAGLTTPPLSSGPMKIKTLDLGRSITFERVKDYWAANLPVNKGKYNFDWVHIDYYRDSHAALEAFRAGLYDFRYEFDSKAWHENYHFPAVRSKDVILENVPNKHPPGMKALVFNTRRTPFNNPQVRQALIQMFDFEWINQYLLYGNEKRTTSFFTNTPMMAKGLPSAGEIRLLKPYKQSLPETLFQQAPTLPISDASGNIRNNKKTALALLQQAGWQLKDGKMVHLTSGRPFTFTLLLDVPRTERVTLPFRKNLASIGITMHIKTLDISQYRKRVKDFDFDMASWQFVHSPFPGSEQANSWSSLAADEPHSGNLAGVKNPAIDALVNQLREASVYSQVLDTTRALDRALLWGHYVIPLWHDDYHHIAYWKHIERSRNGHPYFHVLETMWYKPLPSTQ